MEGLMILVALVAIGGVTMLFLPILKPIGKALGMLILYGAYVAVWIGLLASIGMVVLAVFTVLFGL